MMRAFTSSARRRSRRVEVAAAADAHRIRATRARYLGIACDQLAYSSVDTPTILSAYLDWTLSAEGIDAHETCHELPTRTGVLRAVAAGAATVALVGALAACSSASAHPVPSPQADPQPVACTTVPAAVDVLAGVYGIDVAASAVEQAPTSKYHDWAVAIRSTDGTVTVWGILRPTAQYAAAAYPVNAAAAGLTGDPDLDTSAWMAPDTSAARDVTSCVGAEVTR